MDYGKTFVDLQLKGRFDVERIQIVAEIPFETFRKPNCFQVSKQATKVVTHTISLRT